MRNEPISLISTPEFTSLLNNLPDQQSEVALGIRKHLVTEDINEFGVPLLKGTSALDLGLFLLFIETLDEDSSTAALAQIFLVGRLSCKNWIKRLREECMCHIEWVKPEIKTRGNVGKFVVYSWGIFQREVYAPFTPYAKMVVRNWKEQNAKESGQLK